MTPKIEKIGYERIVVASGSICQNAAIPGVKKHAYKANPIKTGFEAMRLGSIIYFVPFFFVLDTAFILKGPWGHIAFTFACAIGGITLISSALQGYLFFVGNLCRRRFWQWPLRLGTLTAGLLLATPGGGLIPWSNTDKLMASAALLIVCFLPVYGLRFLKQSRQEILNTQQK